MCLTPDMPEEARPEAPLEAPKPMASPEDAAKRKPLGLSRLRIPSTPSAATKVGTGLNIPGSP